jgi:hypothetical protein
MQWRQSLQTTRLNILSSSSRENSINTGRP